MRRVSHSVRGSALDQLNKRNRESFNGEEDQQERRTGRGQTPLSLGTRFRRRPLAPSGATLRALGIDRSARPSKGGRRAINAELRPRKLPLKLTKRRNVVREKKVLTREALI